MNEGIEGSVLVSHLGRIPNDTKDFAVTITKDRMYLFGGTVEYHGVRNVWSKGVDCIDFSYSWVKQNELDRAVYGSHAIENNNIVYLLGGIINSAKMARITADGVIGEWNKTTPIPSDMTQVSHSMVIGNKLYLLGGYYGGILVPKVYSATIEPDGQLGKWERHKDLPSVYTTACFFKTDTYLYMVAVNFLLGSGNVQTTATIFEVCRTRITDESGIGTWERTHYSYCDFDRHFDRLQMTVIGEEIYMVGSRLLEGKPQFGLYMASIDNYGALSAWKQLMTLAGLSGYSHICSYNDAVYLAGCKCENVDGYSVYRFVLPYKSSKQKQSVKAETKKETISQSQINERNEDVFKDSIVDGLVDDIARNVDKKVKKFTYMALNKTELHSSYSAVDEVFVKKLLEDQELRNAISRIVEERFNEVKGI